MSRFRAAGIHLFISAIVVLILLALMFGVWYPNNYFKLMGGSGLILLIAGIDLCLGPLLTFIIFKSGKKSLKFDLTVIAILQLAALSFGSYTMFVSRPIFTAFADQEFSVATALEVNDDELNRGAKPEWKVRSLMGPKLAAVQKPTDPQELSDLHFFEFGLGYARFPRLFVPLASQKKQILKAARPLSVLRTIKKENILVINAFLKKQNRPERDFVFVPINSYFERMAAILDAKDATFITILDARPTEITPTNIIIRNH